MTLRVVGCQLPVRPIDTIPAELLDDQLAVRGEQVGDLADGRLKALNVVQGVAGHRRIEGACMAKVLQGSAPKDLPSGASGSMATTLYPTASKDLATWPAPQPTSSTDEGGGGRAVRTKATRSILYEYQ